MVDCGKRANKFGQGPPPPPAPVRAMPERKRIFSWDVFPTTDNKTFAFSFHNYDLIGDLKRQTNSVKTVLIQSTEVQRVSVGIQVRIQVIDGDLIM